MYIELDDVKYPQDVPIEEMISTILSVSPKNSLALQRLFKNVSYLKKHVMGKVVPNIDYNSDNV